jgi:hypothetical protein
MKMSQINQEKIERLNIEAEEIIGLSKKFFSSVPIQTENQIISTGSSIPTLDGYINTKPNYVKSYSWGRLSAEISEMKVELLSKYALWYETSRFIIRKFLSDRLAAFDESHKEGRKYIGLGYPPYSTDNTESFYKFREHFNIEQSILSSIFSVVEDNEKTNKKILREVSIGVGQRIKAEQVIEDWLKKIEGSVSCWLAYIDETTISHLNNLPRTCAIQIITSEIQNRSRFMKEASKLGKVIPKLEIKEVKGPRISSGESQEFSEKERAIIHKRKLVSNNTTIDFGTDLKSSALGNTKHDMVLRETVPSDKELFDEEWNRSKSEWERIEGISIKVTHHKYGRELNKN